MNPIFADTVALLIGLSMVGAVVFWSLDRNAEALLSGSMIIVLSIIYGYIRFFG